MKDQPGNSSLSPDLLKADGGKTKSNAIEIPSIILPKGGGAIKGIDEKFYVNAVNGTASFSIPLSCAASRGVSPSLSISYNSGAGNGVFGLGWNLSSASIKRKTDKTLPLYNDGSESDSFLFADAEDLVPEFKKENDGSFSKDLNGDYIIKKRNSADGSFTISYYKPRIEGSFARIERWEDKVSGASKWRVISKDNTTTLFGWSVHSVIADPNDPLKIFEWLPEFVFDDKGNCSQYIYQKEDSTGFNIGLSHNNNRFKNGQITYTNLYLQKVVYGNIIPYSKFEDPFPAESGYLFSIIFDYGILPNNVSPATVNTWEYRPDAFSEYKAGFEIRTTRLCHRVLFFHHFKAAGEYDGLVKSVNFDYDIASLQGITFLRSVSIFGYLKKDDGSYTSKHLPPTEFEYQRPDWNKDIKSISTEHLVHSPAGLDEPRYQFTDLFNEGLSGILTEQAGGWYYKHNLGGGKFERAKLVSPKPSFTGLGGQLQLADLDADGGKQLVSFYSEPKGYFELNDDNGWQPFQSFPELPNIDLNNDNCRMLDLNGDGKAELLITEDNVFCWYESNGRRGVSQLHKTTHPFDEEAGPHIVFADSKQTIFIADMTGDGMPDIARIRNGDICYWPNLGYGRFGSKTAMDNAPLFDHPGSFNPNYIKLADIDGSGTADIIYTGKNKFSCWMNLSGNSFSSTPFEIEAFPEINNNANITVTDLLGNGVACIVWSGNLAKDAGASLKYIDLMNGKKPHLMVFYKNNMGKEVSLNYAPSTKFYIEDKLAGRPWITKLHFPVHCIAASETLDKISGWRFTSNYKSHHGYYDHAEREFRGFGMVEQTDTEQVEHWTGGLASNLVDIPVQQKPMVSKTWFHTGAFPDNEKILTQFAHEYWYKEMDREGFPVVHHEVGLPEADIIAASGIPIGSIEPLTMDERREAMRACKSMPLRSEVFAHDAPAVGASPSQMVKQLTPYSVSTHNCVIELLQPKGKNRHAIFIVKESEALTYSYERNSEDPRIAHNLNLKLDEYGNILESAAIVYPRLLPDLNLPPDTQQEQNKTLIIYTKQSFTKDVTGNNVYRLRLPAEVKTYELKGVTKPGSIYKLSDLDNILDDSRSTGAEYHEINKPLQVGKAQRRLIENLRSIYYKNDLSGPLALNDLESLALPFENYQLAYTPALLSDIFSPKATDVELADLVLQGKFSHALNELGNQDTNWWVRSGNTHFIQGGETVIHARNRFYMPVSYTDPYGSTTSLTYYSNYFLLIQQIEDELKNRSRVDKFNFHTLSPERMKDINNNLSGSLADELGFVKATAVLGKGNEADEVAGLTSYTSTIEQNAIDAFFATAISTDLITRGKALLQHASTRFLYDLDEYRNTGKPAVVVSITREEHFQKNNASPIQLSFEYSNGLGKTIMKKVQAEPGLAKKVTIDPGGNTYSVTIEDTSLPDPKQLRWIGSGRTILNNKGNPVKQYEPYFSTTHHYEDQKELVETGVTPLMYYDPVGRLVRTNLPDGTFTRVEFDSWKQIVYDANDNMLDPECSWYLNRTNLLINAALLAAGKSPSLEKIAADKAARHAILRISCTWIHWAGRCFLSNTIRIWPQMQMNFTVLNWKGI